VVIGSVVMSCYEWCFVISMSGGMSVIVVGCVRSVRLMMILVLVIWLCLVSKNVLR